VLKISRGYYSESEICTIYRNADKNQDKIKLLQELTLLKESEIIRILKKNGYEIEKPNKEKLLHFYNKGLSDARIARYLNVSESTIRNWRLKLGLPSNTRKRAE